MKSNNSLVLCVSQNKIKSCSQTRMRNENENSHRAINTTKTHGKHDL